MIPVCEVPQGHPFDSGGGQCFIFISNHRILGLHPSIHSSTSYTVGYRSTQRPTYFESRETITFRLSGSWISRLLIAHWILFNLYLCLAPMIPAKRSATSRHISNTILRTSRHHARPISSISLIRTTPKPPTLLNTENTTGHNSNWRVYKRGYATTSKLVPCFAQHVALTWNFWMS